MRSVPFLVPVRTDISQGDDVKKGDNLISFDMTLVEMELNIAKLKLEKQEQDLTKAQNRLTSLQNGGPIEDSTDSTDDAALDTTGGETGDTGSDGDMTSTDTPSGSDGDDDRRPPFLLVSLPPRILKKLVAFMMPVLGALILQAAYGAVDLLVTAPTNATFCPGFAYRVMRTCSATLTGRRKACEP